MSDQGTRDRLLELVRGNSRLELKDVADDQVLNFDLGYDSAALLNLMLDIEDAFGIEIPPEKVPELVGITFGELVEKVAGAVSGRGDLAAGGEDG